MNDRRRLADLLLIAGFAVVLSACAGPRGSMGQGGPPYGQARTMPGGMMGGPGMMGGYGRGMRGGYGGGMGGSMLRHRQAMMNGIPSDYAKARNPLPATRDVIAAGASLYRANCASCHGETGIGDGPAAAGMSPPPANLRWTMQRPIANDGYLMWAISDGGATLGTAMPAFAGVLDEQDRWRIVRYLRTL